MVDHLKIIQDWEFKNWPDDFYKFADFIRNCWREDYGYYKLWGRRLWLSTGGWSENEAIMSAIARNKTFNMVCWEMERRGGHYKYELPAKNATKKKKSK